MEDSKNRLRVRQCCMHIISGDKRGKGLRREYMPCISWYCICKCNVCIYISGEGLFTRAWRDKTRSNVFKMKEGRFRSDLRKKFFTMRVMRRCHRLPREAVAVPSLAVFKARLDGASINLSWWKVSLPMAGGLELGDPEGAFLPKPFYDSVISVLNVLIVCTLAEMFIFQ